MRVIRSSTNTRLAIHIDTETERVLMDRLFHRALNTWEPQPPMLLDAHEQIKQPLAVAMPAVFRSNRPIPARVE